MPPAYPHLVRLRSLGGPLAALFSVVAGGCYYGDAGLAPNATGFYYPTGLVVSPGRNTLYVANSDFDLEYSGGTVQAVDLVDLRTTLATMLNGIRCTEGNAASCVAYGGMPAPTSSQTLLDIVCNSIPVTPQPAGAPGTPCAVQSDCASGLCISNGTANFCQACTQDSDCGNAPPPPTDAGTDAYINAQCYGYGKCLVATGACMLSCNINTILTPSMCTAVSPHFSASATVGAFASGAVLALNPDTSVGGARLFVPVRGDPSITWFDVGDDRPSVVSRTCAPLGGTCSAPSDCCTGVCDATRSPAQCGFQLSCGQTSLGGRCDDDHRLGVDPYDNLRDLSLPVEPVGLDVSADGTEIVTAHNIAGGGAIGLSVNSWPQHPVADLGAGIPSDSCNPAGDSSHCPSFAYYLSGSGSVASGPTEVAHVPAPAIVEADAGAAGGANTYEQGFMVTYDLTPEVDLYRASLDDQAGASPARPFLNRASQTAVTVNATGSDSRGIVIDPTARQGCEAGCKGDTACLAACVDVPLPVFIANRAPPSLLLGQVQTTMVAGDIAAGTPATVFDTLTIYDQTPLALGASKVALGTALQPDGTRKSYVFAVAFDSRKIFMYDPTSQRVVQVIETGRGPHAIAFDVCTTECLPGEAPHAYLYVGHFTDSYIGVVDLDLSHPETFGTMFASVGAPLPPVESQ